MRILALAILGIGIVSNRDSLYRAGGRPDVRSGLSGLPARVRPDQLLRMPLTRRCLRATRRHQAARHSASSIHISRAPKRPRAIGIAGSTRARFWNEPHRPQDRLHHARDPGGGNRLAGVDCVTACQGCALARICPHCATPVQPNSRIPSPVRQVCRLAPKVDKLVPRSPLC
jgi:hypothetical protein